MKRLLSILLLLALVAGLPAAPISAQGGGIPAEIPGEAVYIPFPSAITLDGKLDDWADIPSVTVTKGSTTSADPAENGSFSFALAADSANVYLTMSSVDATIITGQHGTDFWNEDSLEFYFNFSTDRYASAYGDGMFQVNINPGDIGNSDPQKLTITGVNSASANVSAYLFDTADGWGFEAQIPLPAGFSVEHGREIGFQAQANGASTLDRDVKLIWSNADDSDQSWSNPSLFGSAIFFEKGQTDVPQPSERPAATETVAAPRLSLNQVGYFPNSPKYAMVAGIDGARSTWTLNDAATGALVKGGATTLGKLDDSSGDYVQVVDFSEVTTPGTYTLTVKGITSAPFVIGNALYPQLSVDALRYFYLNRSGIELDPKYAGEWARPAGHLSDADVTCYSGTDAAGKTWEGCDYRLNGSKGWYDAGDYGKYVVNGGIATWTLLNAYEHHPDYFSDGAANIPESGNGIPDVLDEARWEMEFMLGMQVPAGEPLAGMAHHKLHDLVWSGVPTMVPTEVDNDSKTNGRYAMPPSTAATLNLAATAAQCARIWKEIDSAFAERCLQAAESAWTAAKENPVMLAGNTPGQGGGNYDDQNITDEQFWAAAELYITTGKAEYHDFVVESSYFAPSYNLNGGSYSPMWWGGTASLGTISLALLPNGLSEAEIAALKAQIVRAADRYLQAQASEGYRVSVKGDNFVWGSSSDVLNSALVMALAYDFSEDVRYLNGVSEAMDYLLGRNALQFSFISGYGDNAMLHPHHRFWGNQPANGFPPPPPGAISGGVNASPSDPSATEADLMSLPPAKRHLDVIGSYSTNEVAINWNAPLVWVSSYLDWRLGK
ncbi:MAG: glycoside hydrolase family 9 protein [Anaerolineae bacterium]|nr:glycoside hydrolase family 9 protein [Anaerolineae bacterium]